MRDRGPSLRWREAVIVADSGTGKTPDLLRAMGRFVDSLGGRYITSFDYGTTQDDIRVIGEQTSFVAGTKPGAEDASQSTAYGVFACLRAAVRTHLARADLEGARIVVQGAGNVGGRLAGHLRDAGAAVYICDMKRERAEQLAEEIGATVIEPANAQAVAADVFAPCALGGVLTRGVVPQLGARVVVGGANHQLASSDVADDLRKAGILYCPDYLANAGGIIALHHQHVESPPEILRGHLDSLGDVLLEVCERAKAEGIAPAAVTDRLAEARFSGNASGGARGR